MRREGSHELIFLSTDGSEGNYYELASIVWSPDSSKIAAYRVKPGYHREVHYVSSSPDDQLQPENFTVPYEKPGDVLDLDQPVLFDVAAKKQTNIDHSCSSIRTRSQNWFGGRTAAHSPSNTTSAAIRCIE